ncbi:MAG: hypothetical protein BGO82_15540 [Devosia sp. 67-54]|uniref:OmpA family protein n=1 Tax=unclassified Devosia TaxID=196773 RepID=UPI00096028B1|nr:MULTISPECIES: OmpA family protein [unclassified Devosia]MBN9303785.1 OmpA family protein [Devosia sp.]OJX17653.1 MAG: hypothetical protein BGO82_15540 [Devosia sp. 67-54]
MRLRNWLLTGTSVTLLALAPTVAARAQDTTNADLVAAYQAYAADQNDDNKQKLTEACIAAGFQSFDDCVAAMSSAQPPAAPAPAPQQAAPAPEQPAPSSEAPAPAPEQPAPAPEQPAPAPQQPAPAPEQSAPAPEQPAPAPEQPAPAPEQPAPVSEQPAPAPEPAPAPSSAQPAPAPEQKPAAPDIGADLKAAVQLYNKGAADIGAGKTKRGKQEIDKASGQIAVLCQTGGFADAQSCLAQYGLTLDPIPEAPAPSSEAPAPAPSAEPAPAPAPAPAPSSEAPASSSEQAAPTPAPAPAPAPSSEQAAPAPSSEAPAPAPSSEAPPPKGAVKKLTAAVELYNQGVAELTAGDAAGQAKIDKANASISKICTDGGFADTATCLAQFGLTLSPLPAAPGEPAASSEQQQAASSAEPAPPASSVPPISEQPNASEAVTPSAVEVLPSEVKPDEAAPILDSVKDQQTQPADQGQPSQPAASSEAPPPPATPPAPPPKTDQQAQADIAKPTPEQQSTLTDKGTKSKVQDIQIAPPQGNGDQPVKVIQLPPGPGNPPQGNPPPNGKPPANGNPPPQPPPAQNNTGVIIQIGVNVVINNPEQERSRYYDPREDEIYYEDLGRGRTRETVTRPNGTKIVTIRSRHGDVLQRSKILPNGREILLSTYDPKDTDIDTWRDPGADLPPLHLTIPASDYILDARSADDEEVTDFLDQPPVEQVRRIYTIDEVKRSARLRDSVRRLEVGGLTFDTGKATIARSQVGALSKVADAMQKLLDRNPGEVFLIEGHTDAVGSDISNLVLSDQRAATVARILTDFYDIPPENLVTQGYGERYLRVKTQAAEPLNRRVTIKRITPLVTYTAER